MLSKWLWMSRCGDYWQQAEQRTDGACRIMMMNWWWWWCHTGSHTTLAKLPLMGSIMLQSKAPSADRAQLGQRNICPGWDSLANSSAEIFMHTWRVHWLQALCWRQSVLREWLHEHAQQVGRKWQLFSCHLVHVHFMQQHDSSTSPMNKQQTCQNWIVRGWLAVSHFNNSSSR